MDFCMEACDLCIVGTGYAGINALNAASKYLQKGARIVVVDRGYRWGGNWRDQYEFVRLHQPYQGFTAGERDWSISGLKAPEHLASKTEILAHFEDIVALVVEEKALDLVMLWGYEYRGHSVEGGKVQLVAHPLMENVGADVLPVKVTAGKMINATGLDVQRKLPFVFPNVSHLVHSLSPSDVGTAKWNALMRHSRDAAKPIWIIGSGKTAVDVILKLCTLGADVRSRLRCVSGRGTWFMNRDVLQDAGKYFLDMVDMFDGGNAGEVFKEMQRKGLLHSPIDDARCFVLGICSGAEVAAVRAALMPPKERVIKAHLVDMEQGADGAPSFKLRALDGQTIFHRSIEPGSFVVNCTDNISFTNRSYEPIVSDGGLVLSPQSALGFTGPTAHLLTHAWLLGKLDGFWRTLPRITIGNMTDGKESLSFYGFFRLFVVMPTVVARLPKEITRATKALQSRTPPTPEFLERTMRLMPVLWEKLSRMVPQRYDDPAVPGDAEPEAMKVLGGNIGQLSRL